VKARLSQCRIKVAEWSGLFVALVVAAAFSDVTSNAAWKRIWRAFTLWLDIWRTPDPTVPADVREARLEACRACPVYYAKLRTCGTPMVKELRDMGCWCFLPSKSRYSAATCWLEDELGEEAPHGWKKILQHSQK